MQSVPISTKVVSSNPVHGEMYLIQPYVKKLDIDLRLVAGTPVSYTNKNDRYDIAEILLKVMLNTIVLTLISRHETTTNCFYIYITYHSSPQFRLCLTMNFKKENGRVILAIYVLVSCTLPS